MPSSSANFQTKSHVGKVEVERKQSGPSICSAPNAPADVPIALWSTRDSIEHVKKLLKLFKAEEGKKSSRDLGTAADACNGPCISSAPNAQAEMHRESSAAASIAATISLPLLVAASRPVVQFIIPTLACSKSMVHRLAKSAMALSFELRGIEGFNRSSQLGYGIGRINLLDELLLLTL